MLQSLSQQLYPAYFICLWAFSMINKLTNNIALLNVLNLQTHFTLNDNVRIFVISICWIRRHVRTPARVRDLVAFLKWLIDCKHSSEYRKQYFVMSGILKLIVARVSAAIFPPNTTCFVQKVMIDMAAFLSCVLCTMCGITNILVAITAWFSRTHNFCFN